MRDAYRMAPPFTWGYTYRSTDDAEKTDDSRDRKKTWSSENYSG